MKYTRARLAERKWHKVVINDVARLGRVDAALLRLTGPYMQMGGGHWKLIMIATYDDVVALRLMIDFLPEDYRGFGDWSKKTYNSAKSNRITRDENSLPG